ncbi:MAG: LysR substrate-binding domain-containing protein, partial [Nocardioidaceae bacterium]
RWCSARVFASAGEIWLPPIVKMLRGEFPDVLVTVTLNEYDGTRVASTPEIDIRTESTTDPPAPVSGYRRHPLLDEPYRLLLPPDHPLTKRDDISLSELAGEQWIDDDQSNTTCGVIVRKAWRAAGFSPRFAARSADHHATKAFVAAGIGIALMPELALAPLPESVAVRRIVGPEPRRLVTAFVREGADLNPAVRRVIELLEEVAGATPSYAGMRATG